MRGEGKGGSTHEGNSRRRMTVTSSLNEISTDQLGIRVVVREGGVTPPTPMHSFLQQASGQIFKDDVNGFSSTSDSYLTGGAEHPAFYKSSLGKRELAMR
jgi:hypothetical protein